MKMLHDIAFALDDAARYAKAIPQISLTHRLTEEEAYDVQNVSINRRYERGEHLVGFKLGFTSRAKMLQMGVHDVIWGRLTDAMLLEEGGTLQLSKFIHPRVEPEICYLIKKKIDRPITQIEAGQYLEAVAPAIEIIDSRYENFKFSLEDVIADNCSSAGVVIGQWFPPQTDVSNLGMVLEIDQKVVQIGSSAAILGNPLRSLVAAVRLVTDYGKTIHADSILLAGAATSAVFINKNQHVQARVERLGSVGISIV